MATKPKISVVTITYNQEAYIRQTLDGFVLQQTDFPVEFIVADDGSQDKTPEIIAEYARAHPKIFKPVLRKKNIGAIANMIDTMRQATAPYIAICEGDDYWTDPLKLQTQADFLDQHRSYVGCFHAVRVIFEGSQDKPYIYPDVTDGSWYTVEELLKINYIPTNSVLYRRQNYDNLPTNVMPFDWYLHLYHAQFGKLKFMDKVMSVYRKHAGGLWWEYDRNRDEIWRKYGLSYMALYNEVLKIHGQNPQRRKIIEASISTMLGRLIEVDKQYGEKLFEKALQTYPDNAEFFMVSQHEQLHQQEQAIENLKTQLLGVGDERSNLVGEIDNLRRQIADLNEELRTITDSRTWRARNKTVAIKRKLRGR